MEALKAVYGPSHQIQASLRSSDGSTLLTDKKDSLHRWSEHFEGLLLGERDSTAGLKSCSHCLSVQK